MPTKNMMDVIGVLYFYKSDMLSFKDDRKPDSKADWHQIDGIGLKPLKTESA